MKPIIEFIDARLPGFAGAVRGAPPEAIAALQARTSRPLPRLYLDFLRTMGEDSSVYPAFPGYIWSASALLDGWPGDDAIAYDKDRYFKIALNPAEAAISYEDYFLDLTRSDGDDAPMVAFEDPSEDGIPGEVNAYAPNETAEIDLGLRTWLCLRAFHFFELMRRKELADVGISTDLKHPETTLQHVCRTLERFGLNQPLHAPKSWFGVADHLCVEALLLYRSVSVRVGARSKRDLLTATELLRDNLDVIGVEEVPRQDSPMSL